jgi:hypothetical protein
MFTRTKQLKLKNHKKITHSWQGFWVFFWVQFSEVVAGLAINPAEE